MLSGNIKKDIGTRIKKVRTKSGLTQIKFAENIDISADYILYGENDNSSENTLDHIKKQ